MTGRLLANGLWKFLPAAAWLLAGVVSCRYAAAPDEGMLQSVNLAVSVGSFQTTKIDPGFTEVNPDNPVFRGIVDVKLVPFNFERPVLASDQACGFPLSIPGFYSLGSYVPAFFYTGVEAWIPSGTSSFLLYGRAPGDGTDTDLKHRYGSLLADGFSGGSDAPKVSSLKFAPDVMFSGEQIPEDARVIASVLNGIVRGDPYQVEAVYADGKSKILSLNWNENTEESNLREAFRQITNEGAFIPGSGPLIEDLLSGLYALLSHYESHNTNVYEVVVDGVPYEARKEGGSPLLYKDLFNGLKDHVLARFRSQSVQRYVTIDEMTVRFRDEYESVGTYPESLGLPSGCAILRWTPTGFVVPQLDGVEGIAPMNRYCYPPALYYYCNTTLRTSQEDNVGSVYSDEAFSSWDKILERYTLGKSITSHTKSIALVKPAQFAMGLLQATVKASRTWLQDNDGLPETTVDVSGDCLPLTGIILGGQYAQNFDFTPIYTQDGEYYLYDNRVPDVFLKAEESDPIRTLSLQTPAGQDVYFTLEFQNNSGKTFYGADGRILPGRKFYMVGKLELPDNPEFDSVFVKGHVTRVTCIIHSLDGAYNAVPDLGIPQLVVGVQTQVNWILSSPSTLMLE